MVTYKLKGLLQNSGWILPAYVSVDDGGNIISVSSESNFSVDYDLNCYALPGFQNAHSHAFQYAMAGLAERHSTDKTPDDFWSWREAMYALALRISPDDLEVIAAMLYAEMLRHGYTNVAEFHYVHHDKNGKSFDNLSEMGERLIAAAKRVGIGITLIPIFYQKGGFGVQPSDRQKRFISADIDAYMKLFEASEKACSFYEHANIALGIHSMRGVEPEVIKDVAKNGRKDVPFHIHIAEQLKEVEDCINHLSKRPVEWMLENLIMDDRFHLVHATHLTQHEINGIAKTGANVVLCPSTEGNLGDGIFPLIEFQKAGGNWSIGTDSHVGLNPFEELRILDYGQRLISHKRNIFYSSEEGDSGMFAFTKTTQTGRKSMHNFEPVFFKPGEPFNAALIDFNSPLIASRNVDDLASTMLYSTDSSMQCGAIAFGKLISQEIFGEQRLKIKSEFTDTLRNLIDKK